MSYFNVVNKNPADFLNVIKRIDDKDDAVLIHKNDLHCICERNIDKDERDILKQTFLAIVRLECQTLREVTNNPYSSVFYKNKDRCCAALLRDDCLIRESFSAGFKYEDVIEVLGVFAGASCFKDIRQELYKIYFTKSLYFKNNCLKNDKFTEDPFDFLNKNEGSDLCLCLYLYLEESSYNLIKDADDRNLARKYLKNSLVNILRINAPYQSYLKLVGPKFKDKSLDELVDCLKKRNYPYDKDGFDAFYTGYEEYLESTGYDEIVDYLITLRGEEPTRKDVLDVYSLHQYNRRFKREQGALSYKDTMLYLVLKTNQKMAEEDYVNNFKARLNSNKTEKSIEELVKDRTNKYLTDNKSKNEVIKSQNSLIESYKNEISELKKKVEKAGEPYKKELSSLRSENDTLKKEVEDNKKELAPLRTLFFNSENDDEPIADAKTEKLQEIAKNKSVCVIGGHQNFLAKIKNDFPDWTFVACYTWKKGDIDKINAADLIVMLNKHIDHSQYYRTMEVIRKNKKPLIYSMANSIPRLLLDMREKLV